MLFNFKTLLSVSILFSQISALAFSKSEIVKRDGVSAFKLGFDVQKTGIATTYEKRGDVPVAANNANITYLADIQFGSEKDVSSLIIDTGSSDSWVKAASAGGKYDPSKSTTYKDLGTAFGIRYVDQSGISGTWAQDTIHLGDNSAEVRNFQFGVGTEALGLGFEYEGTLGISFYTSEAPSIKYWNLPYSLKNQGYIDKVGYSLYLNDRGATSGTLLFGGIDKAKYEGDLVTVPVTNPSRLAVQVDSIAINGQVDFNSFEAILDSGTTNSFLPEEQYNLIQEQIKNITGSIPDKYLEFTISGTVIKVPYSDILEKDDTGHYSTNIHLNGGDGDVIILGDTFLRHAYVVFNLEDREISLAQVKYTEESDIVSL